MLGITTQLETREFIPDYKARSIVLGKEIRILPPAGTDGTRDELKGTPATAVDIAEDGGLVVRLKDGTNRTLNSGEISIRFA